MSPPKRTAGTRDPGRSEQTHLKQPLKACRLCGNLIRGGSAQLPLFEAISRTNAATRGLTRYTSTKPCPRGHVGQRFTTNCSCCECTRIANTASRDRVRALLRAARVKRPTLPARTEV